MNLISAHFTAQKIEPLFQNLRFDNDGNGYRVLELPQLNIYLTEEQSEYIFELIDAGLHKETYSDLEDKVLTLSDSLEVANEALTTLREIARGE